MGVEKFVGDYFDAFVVAARAVIADKAFIPDGTRQLEQWKDRTVAKMQAFAKTHQFVTAGGRKVLLISALEVPEEFDSEKICEVITAERPAVVKTVGECRPNYATWDEIDKSLKTTVPAMGAMGEEADEIADQDFPAELGSDTNKSIESCRRLLRHSSGADYIEASLAVLDVRACLHSGGDEQPKFSRSWVADCIPKDLLGYPGSVYKFMGEYGVPGNDCVPSYGGLSESGHCPSLCENGESLAGHLKRPDGTFKVIYTDNGAGAFANIDAAKHALAKQYIYNDGPIVGFVLQTNELVSCARDDLVVFNGGCADDGWDNTLQKVHSVVVHGWGAEGSIDYYRTLTSFQDDDHEARIAECAVKAFVIPQTTKGFATSDYDKHLQAIKAEARCPRGTGFCNANGGYTDTEDCDGDGVLDHWCYIVGDAETPTYEAFISSRTDCTTVERSCRRSVLPGRHFGCQRPLGWCMHGERYRRDVDCDGDGHFDHVCEKDGHDGYIASSEDCIDTWEDGPNGAKCEPQAILEAKDASIQYKFVSDYGNCVQHSSPQCFVSHEDWPNSNYPIGVCQFHVEFLQPVPTQADTTGCDTTGAAAPNETLWLEVVQMDIEGAVFNENGWLYGERLLVNGINTKSSVNAQTNRKVAEFVEVKDKDIIKWSTDESVQEKGWLVCLRLKKKIPAVHKAACSEIGTDIWSTYFTVDDTRTVVSVECDMTKCNKAQVPSVDAADRYTFFLTTNVCDAGWQAARSNKFDVAFSGPTSTAEPTFEVLL